MLISGPLSDFLLCISYADLEQDGFSKNPFFHGIVAEVPEQHKTKEGEEERDAFIGLKKKRKPHKIDLIWDQRQRAFNLG